IAWLVATPLLVVLCALGGANLVGGWYGGLAGSPSWAAPAAMPFERPEPLAAHATAAGQGGYRIAVGRYNGEVRQWRDETPRATRNSALGAVTALLLGLVGSVIGGWIASGEPMTFTYYRTRRRLRQASV